MAQYQLRTFGLPAMTSVASSASSVALFGKNDKRQGMIIQNTSTAILYVLFVEDATGTATTTTSHSIQIPANQSYEIVGFTGGAVGIWASANGTAQITQFS